MKWELIRALKKIGGIHASRVEHHSPCVAVFKTGQQERNRLVMAVEQQDEVIINDRPPPVIVFVGRVAL